MGDKGKKDLCFNCDEKYQFGHQCKGAKVFLLEGSPLESDQLSKVLCSWMRLQWKFLMIRIWSTIMGKQILISML